MYIVVDDTNKYVLDASPQDDVQIGVISNYAEVAVENVGVETERPLTEEEMEVRRAGERLMEKMVGNSIR